MRRHRQGRVKPRRTRLAIPLLAIGIAIASVIPAGTSLAAPATSVSAARLRAYIAIVGAPSTAGLPTRFRLTVALPARDKVTAFRLSYGDGSAKVKGIHLPSHVGHTFAGAGTYTVRLWIKDRHTRTASTALRVRVSAAATGPGGTGSGGGTSGGGGTGGGTGGGSTGGGTGGGSTGGGTGGSGTGGGISLRQKLGDWTAGHPSVGNPTGVLQPPAADNGTLGPVPNLFPGAIIEGSPTNIENGILTPVPLTPGSGTVTLTGIQLARGGTVTSHLARADEGSVTQAIQDLRAQDQFKSNGLDTSHLEFQQVSSSQQSAEDVNASFSYAGVGSASGDFSEANDQTENHLLFEMDQTYYAVSYKPDYLAGGNANDLDAFFAPGTSAAQAADCGCMSASAPPMFVSHVTYGTRFVFLASSKSDTSEMKAALKASLSYGAASGNVAFTSDEKSALDEMSLSVVAIGGNVQDIGTAEVGALGNNGKNVTSWLSQFIQHSLGDDVAYSVPLAYTLEYLDYANVGEFVPRLPAANPIPASDTVDSLKITVKMGSDDKSWQTPVDVSFTDNLGEQLIPGPTVPGGVIAGPGGNWNASRQYSPFCPNPHEGNDYWNNGQSGQPAITCTIPLPHPIPAYAIAGSRLEINGPGDSWHAGFTVSFPLPAVGSTPAGDYVAFTTDDNMFFDVDPHNGDPCNDQYHDTGYWFQLYEPRDPAAQSPGCFASEVH